MTDQMQVARRWEVLSPHLNKQQQAIWAAAEAGVIGRGGFLMLSRITGISAQAISRRTRLIQLVKAASAGSLVRVECPVRRTRNDANDPKIMAALELVVREEIARNPTGRKRWVRGSLGVLCNRLKERGCCAEPKTVSRLLRKLGYSLKMTSGRKPTEMNDPGIETALQAMLSEEIAGDPMGRQKWVRSSLRNLSSRLKLQGHKGCTHVVARLLRKLGYSLQIAQKQRAPADIFHNN